jgi:hypothetical protein
MDPAQLKISPLRISTMVVTAHLGTSIDLQKMMELFDERAIPLSWPGEGFLKVEYKPILTVKPDATASELQRAKQKAKQQEKIIVGTCSRDELTKRKKSKNIFFNQSTLVVRREYMKSESGNPVFKEVNIKLFKNGGIQMTGIPAEEFAKETLQWLLNQLTTVKADVFTTKPELQKFKVQLINSDYQVSLRKSLPALKHRTIL